ncbi:MAG: extracellular solute-binding protein [Abditibacteriales bacterium]|nr:extracellular solute-binding protein [Abditibacteriales bacterium]MDW8365073.1 extracellular solute-binding protein [Abditibacteriales bacterium]
MKQVRCCSILFFLLINLPLCALASAAEKIVLLSPHWEGIRKEYREAFRQWHKAQYGTEVDLDFLIMGGTSEIMKFIGDRFAKHPDGIGVDVFWGGGIAPYMTLAQQGLLEPYKVPDAILSKIPKDYGGMPMYDAEYRWYGSAMSGFGIIYNRAVLRVMNMPEPQTWADLARPEFLTWVGSGDPRHSGSIHMMYEIILQAYGWDKGWEIIKRMGANIRNFPRGGGQTSKDVALGETAVGLSIDLYALTQIAQARTDQLAFVLPEGQTIINCDPIAILKGAPHKQLAQRLVDFVLSEEGQKILMLPAGAAGGPREFTLNRMSVLPSLYRTLAGQLSTPSNPFEMKVTMRYDAQLGSARRVLVDDLIGALVIDNHRDLTRAWRALIEAGMPEAAAKKFAAMPLTEAEALRLCAPASPGSKKTKWETDPVLKSKEMTRWAIFAKQQYAEVVRMTRGGSGGMSAAYSALRWVFPALAAALVVGIVGSAVWQGMRRWAEMASSLRSSP